MVLPRPGQFDDLFRKVKYHSLLANRRETVAKVFDYLGIPAENVDIACEALRADSQAGVGKVSWDSRKHVGGIDWKGDGDVAKRCNIILEEFGLSGVNFKLDFPDIVCKICMDFGA